MELTIPPVERPFENVKLNKKQTKLLKVALSDAKVSLNEHFNRSGAWNLTSDLYVSEVANKIFGVDFYYHTISHLIHNIPGIVVKTGKFGLTFVNEKEKVFIDTTTGNLYVATEAIDVEYDENLGDL